MPFPRRSWFQLPRWRWSVPAYAIGFFVALTIAERASGEPFASDLVGRAVLAAVMAVRSTWSWRRSVKGWQELESSSLATDAELLTAERVVRLGERPTGDLVRREARRIVDLRVKELGGSRLVSTAVAAVLASGALVAGLLASPWWLVLSAACCAAAIRDWLSMSRLLRRRLELIDDTSLATSAAAL